MASDALDVEAATRARAREAIAELEALLSKWVPELEGTPRTRKIFLELRNSSGRILDHHPDYQEDGACPDPAWPPLRLIDGGGP